MKKLIFIFMIFSFALNSLHTIVVSDLDDTIMASNNKLKNFNQKDHYGPEPFIYLIKLIKALEIDGNDIAYVTASPLIINLGYIAKAFQIKQFKNFSFKKHKWLINKGAPLGLLLRPIMPLNQEQKFLFKYKKIKKFINHHLLCLKPNEKLRVIMFGDNGEMDMMAYHIIYQEFSHIENVEVNIFIRQINLNKEMGIIPKSITLFKSEDEIIHQHPFSEYDLSEELILEIEERAKKLFDEYQERIYL